MTRRWLGLGAFVVLLSMMPTFAAAQDSSTPPPPAGEEAPPERSGTDPYEDPTKDYFFFGGVYRFAWVPKTVVLLFVDEAVSGKNHQFGGEFIYRRNGMDLIIDAYYARFYADGPFLERNGDPLDTEIINSRLWTATLSATFLWSAVVNDVLAFEFGLGIGIGYVGGQLRRTEAYPSTGAGSIDGYAPCTGVGGPDAAYCDGPSVPDGESGGHYNVVTRDWLDGGSVPVVWPRLAFPHIAIRIKPIRQLMLRVEGGLDFFSGFFGGGAIAFGF